MSSTTLMEPAPPLDPNIPHAEQAIIDMVNRDPERYKTVEGQNELRLWLYQQPFNAAREALFRLNTGASRSLKNPARIIEYLVLKHVKFERKFWASSLGIYLNDQAKSGSLHARSNGKLIRLALLQRPHEDNSTESIRYVIVAIARACRQDIKDPATVHDMKMSHMRWRLEYQVNHAIKCQFHEQCGGFLVCPKQCAGESQLSTRCVWRGQPICVDCSDRKEPERRGAPDPAGAPDHMARTEYAECVLRVQRRQSGGLRLARARRQVQRPPGSQEPVLQSGQYMRPDSDGRIRTCGSRGAQVTAPDAAMARDQDQRRDRFGDHCTQARHQHVPQDATHPKAFGNEGRGRRGRRW